MVSIAILSIDFRVDKTNLDAHMVLYLASIFGKSYNSVYIGERRYVCVASSFRSFR